MFIRYADSIPVISAGKLDQHLDEVRGKVVFLGVTALSMANDRLKIPSGETIPGVTAHAQTYETIRRGRFLTDASSTSILTICIGLATATAVIFAFLTGWRAYVAVLPVLALPLFLPRLFLNQDIVFPITAPSAVAWLCFAGAATYQHFIVRRSLLRAESDKSRYQEAIHWAAHEMRTPLTAIQGSSELMSRYKLPEEKRGELSAMINSESKRLSRIIQTFLDVERIAEGQTELKKEPFQAADVVDTCIARVRPIAERKSIALTLDTPVVGTITGDRELMEYAFYNLLTNAVKYSPSETHIRVVSDRKGPELRLAVHDQGIGMDAKELKSIFKKFYRTKRAEQSGEVGTGIGLSIVQQIVTHHGGRIDVTSTPGKGSCFTMILSVQNAETVSR
jgi:signal transduction histidine kinase